MPLIYECFYSGISLVSEFNEIEAFIIFEFISFGFNRFNVIKKVIKKDFLNEYIIKIRPGKSLNSAKAVRNVQSSF